MLQTRYKNEPIPAAYSHLLRLLAGAYVLLAPAALVPAFGLAHRAAGVGASCLVAGFYHGFCALATQMLTDPFCDADGFDLAGFHAGTESGAKSVERNVPMLGWDSPEGAAAAAALLGGGGGGGGEGGGDEPQARTTLRQRKKK